LNLRRTAYRDAAPAEEAAQRVDPDWAYRWKEKAPQISVEEMQQLWAKVLVREHSRPGSFSLRTLDLLFSLRKEEAELIAKAANFCFDQHVIYSLPEYYSTRGLTLNNLIELENMGVLTGVTGALGNNLHPQLINNMQAFVLIYNSQKAILLEKGNDDVLRRLGYFVTAVGRELMQIGNFDGDLEFLTIFAKILKDEYHLKAYVADIERYNMSFRTVNVVEV
jgi:hypothetical protein